jgi:hydrocephalus-inducing protein
VSISPESGQLAPHSAETITVSFEALNVQRYQLQLLMDLAVPRMQLSCPVLEYGECFMGYSYQRSITLVNESKLPARFEVLDQVGRGA